MDIVRINQMLVDNRPLGLRLHSELVFRKLWVFFCYCSSWNVPGSMYMVLKNRQTKQQWCSIYRNIHVVFIVSSLFRILKEHTGVLSKFSFKLLMWIFINLKGINCISKKKNPKNELLCYTLHNHHNMYMLLV